MLNVLWALRARWAHCTQENAARACSTYVTSAAESLAIPALSPSLTLCYPNQDRPRQILCSQCEAGTYQDDEGSTECKDCILGHYCPKGSSTPIPCSAGLYGSRLNLKQEDECESSPPGSYSAIGSSEPKLCALGTFANRRGSGACDACHPGTYASLPGTVNCALCEPGHWYVALHT